MKYLAVALHFHGLYSSLELCCEGRKIDVTRERISCILELREILLSFQTGFGLFNAAVVCAILKSISSLEPSSVTTEPRYLKLVTVSSFFQTTGVVCHQLGLLSTDHHAISCGGFVKMLN